ncbi:MAG: protein-L-isoaspartate O-methyltransferase [Micavibrio sp.]|mgnify:CR=1 FL=1|nr:protein-L-isoaspartate O-methyltransferase [Micavibrio sp.]|tara:strand:- start:4014 stop:4703 length:690 start_codon:yes stop_codon:yes gene_type:complete
MNADATQKIRLIMYLRQQGIHSTDVLSAIERTPRESFIPAMFHDQAYEDLALPIGRGQTISQPLVVAHMTQSLELDPMHKVLEIGTGCGYQAAILSKLCRRVYTIERHRPLFENANATLDSLRIRNITTLLGDGMQGWTAQAPFDRIIVTAAARQEAPFALTSQLKVGGFLVIPIGEAGDQWLYKYTKQPNGQCTRVKLFEVRFVPLLPDIAKDQEAQIQQDPLLEAVG